MALHARVKRPARDPKQRGRLGLVPLDPLQGLLDQALLDLIEAQAQAQKLGRVTAEPPPLDRQMPALDPTLPREDARPFDQLLTLPAVPRKVVRAKMLQRIGA